MAAPIAQLERRCPAKLNLTLAVGPPRNDGLHPIASVMVALDFGDDLSLRRLDDGPSKFTRRFADDAPKPQTIDWPIETDLAYRAHAMLEQAVGRALPVECSIEKRIPAGAGLGGGSSNAAGMLVGLRDLFGLDVSDDELLVIAQQLGADVVFAVHALLGRRAALVTGIGEVIEPMSNLPSFDVVLMFPDGTCPTAAVYREFDQTRTEQSAAIPEDLIQTWRHADTLPAPHNDLTVAAITVCPAITTAIRTITAQGLAPRLTGSGSALFAMIETHIDAVAIAESIRKAGVSCCITSYSNLPQP